MKSIILFLTLAITNYSFGQKEIAESLLIEWVDSIDGDFSFKDSWSYNENIFRNNFGQLICDNICPVEIDEMKDSLGRIYEDSLAAFYKLIDTTHHFHTISCDAVCYEWGGTNFITVERKNKDEVFCHSMCTVGTHSSLGITISGEFCFFFIKLISVIPNRDAIFNGKSGYLKIDKNLWKKGIMKAEFYFDFYSDNYLTNMYWKGKIYAPIN